MVCPPILMECSVTEDSSFDVAASHLSAAFASGAFASLSGACAASGIACANHKQIPAAQRLKLIFMRLLSRLNSDRRSVDQRAKFYAAGQHESKEQWKRDRRTSPGQADAFDVWNRKQCQAPKIVKGITRASMQFFTDCFLVRPMLSVCPH